MSRIDLCYETCSIATQTVAPTLPYFQGIKRCVQYLASHPHKTIFILLIIMMDQMSSGLHRVEIKLNTTHKKMFRMSSKCRPFQNSQQKTVSFGYYPYST